MIYSKIGSNVVYNIIEYIGFINSCLLFLVIIISIFFILIKSKSSRIIKAGVIITIRPSYEKKVLLTSIKE